MRISLIKKFDDITGIVASSSRGRLYNSNLSITTDEGLVYTENFVGYSINNQNKIIPKKGII